LLHLLHGEPINGFSDYSQAPLRAAGTVAARKPLRPPLPEMLACKLRALGGDGRRVPQIGSNGDENKSFMGDNRIKLKRIAKSIVE